MKTWQYLLGGVGILFLVIQLVPNDLPEVKTDNPGDLIGSGIVSDEVASLIKKSCYDCHSNTTRYPWYAYVAPSSWLVAKDIREAREEVNFSNWNDYDMMGKLAILDDIYSEVEEEHMPMPIYTVLHSDAKLDAAQRQKIMEWAEATMDIIAEEDDSEL
ncbi:heme-binding domain-containing protein [Algoriphagus mannitolivorans]|uniref:heme-binding domain-containing protein n=1 Tax=Algoriphagus mannitolivorans TaxID=226504 RepID=UPI00047CA99C|nr:heme-binding domain-containing protein [Algoriphagus mannitolivorans]